MSDNPANTGTNADLQRLEEKIEKQGGIISKFFGKVFDTDEKPPAQTEPPAHPPNNDDLHTQLLEAKKKEIEYENRIKEFELQEEQRKLAEEKLKEKQLSEAIEKDINELVANRIIAADDKEEIADWKKQFNQDYDGAKKRMEKRIKAITVDVSKEETTDDKSTPSAKELRRERLAARIHSSLGI